MKKSGGKKRLVRGVNRAIIDGSRGKGVLRIMAEKMEREKKKFLFIHRCIDLRCSEMCIQIYGF